MWSSVKLWQWFFWSEFACDVQSLALFQLPAEHDKPWGTMWVWQTCMFVPWSLFTVSCSSLTDERPGLSPTHSPCILASYKGGKRMVKKGHLTSWQIKMYLKLFWQTHWLSAWNNLQWQCAHNSSCKFRDFGNIMLYIFPVKTKSL